MNANRWSTMYTMHGYVLQLLSMRRHANRTVHEAAQSLLLLSPGVVASNLAVPDLMTGRKQNAYLMQRQHF